MTTIESTPFDKVIRRVTDDSVKLKNAEILLHVNLKTNKIAEKSWKDMILRSKFKSYVIGTSGTSKHSAEGISPEFEVNDHKNNKRTAIAFEYRVMCLEGNEDKLVKNIAKFDSPAQALQDALEVAALDYLGKTGEEKFMADFSSEKDRLVEHVESYLSRIMGLEAQLRLKLKHEESLKSEDHNLTLFTKVSDQKEEIEFKLAIGVDVIEEQQLQAIIAFPHLHNITNDIIEEASKFIKHMLIYNDIYDDFDNSDKKPDLTSAINKCLAKYSRKVGSLTLERINGTQFERIINLEVPYIHIPHQTKAEINISNTIQLLLNDPGKFKTSNIINVKQWAEKQLLSILEEEIFDKSYLDFLLHFKSVETILVNRMGELVEKIGYKQKYLASRPEMEEEAYLNPNNYTYKLQDLPTRSANVKVNFDVTVTYHFEDLEKIKDLLNKKQSVKDKIGDKIKSEIITELNLQDPETIYMRFNYDPKSEPLERVLTDRIIQILRDDFCAEISGSPVIKPQETELSRFVKKLLGKSQKLELEIKPLGGSQSFTFTGDMASISIDPASWDKVSNLDQSKFDVVQAFDFYKSAIKSLLEALPSDQLLAYIDGKQRFAIEKVINTEPRSKTIKRFGIVVEVDNFARIRTQQEDDENAVINQTKLVKLENAKVNMEIESVEREHQKELLALERGNQKALLTQAQKKYQEAALKNMLDDDEHKEYLDGLVKVMEDNAASITESASASSIEEDILTKRLGNLEVSKDLVAQLEHYAETPKLTNKSVQSEDEENG